MDAKAHEARQVAERLEALGTISDEPNRLTRLFCSPAMKRANALVTQWMGEAGMEIHQDAVGNLRGRYAGAQPDAKTLVLGSHLDTVRDAGKFDGPLGVVVAIAAVGQLHKAGVRLPFAIEVIGFADEEGVRYQMPYLGSRAVVGVLTRSDLQAGDSKGITMAEAIRQFGGDPDRLEMARITPDNLLGYVEVHIEQGPVLEQADLGLGVVTGITGQTRARVTFSGQAGHAGTTPMNLRRDALCAAAEFILETERLAQSNDRLVATVGQIEAEPGASNVIPRTVRLTLDLRHPEDTKRNQACSHLEHWAHDCAAGRNIALDWQLIQSMDAVGCNARLSDLLAGAVERCQGKVLRLTSGAGHDAVMMSRITPVGVMFVRCRNGLSHHPDEFASVADIGLASRALTEFIDRFARDLRE